MSHSPPGSHLTTDGTFNVIIKSLPSAKHILPASALEEFSILIQQMQKLFCTNL